MATKLPNPNDRIRGSIDIPMTPQGQQQVTQLGQNFKQNGPLDMVIAADLSRTRDTAHAVANGAPVIETHHLRDMDYGIFGGMRSRDAMPIIQKATTKDPDQPLPGSSESFSGYKDRLTNMYKLAIQAQKQFPTARIGLVVNRRSIKTAEGWLENGRTDKEFNDKIANGRSENLVPGDVYKFTGNKEGEYGIQKVDTTKAMEPGVYLIRHGLTSWNGESYEPKDSKD